MGELLVEGGPAAWRGQPPEEAPVSYGPEPDSGNQEEMRPKKHNKKADFGSKGSAASSVTLKEESVVGKTHQPPTLATQAGIFKPGPHVFMRVDDQ